MLEQQLWWENQKERVFIVATKFAALPVFAALDCSYASVRVSMR